MLAVILACLASCANSSHMLVYQKINLGINAGLNPQTGNLHARIGHRKEFACVVPKVSVGNKIKAGSSYVASRVRVNGPLSVPDIAEIIATGKAASNMGSKPDALSPFVTPTKQ